MFGCECLCWETVPDIYSLDPQPFSLPLPIPQWPRGKGFATGRISLGEIEVHKITKFESIWSCTPLHGKTNGVTFYKPVGIPGGYFTIGNYCQPNDRTMRGHILVAIDVAAVIPEDCHIHYSVLDSPALKKPINYTLIWSTDSCRDGCYIWLPNAPAGYKALGFVVTDKPHEPELEEVRCVRADLTETCET